MTKNSIISEIAKSKEYIDACNRITYQHPLSADLFQDVLLILLEKDESYIIDLHTSGTLKFFFIRIILNQFRSNNSPFYKKYRSIFETAHSIDNFDHHEDEPKGIDYSFIDKDLEKPSDNKKDWFEKNLIKALMKEKSLRELCKKSGITYYSAAQAINSYTTRVKHEYRSIQ